MNQTILITGGGGLLGQELLKLDPGLIAPVGSILGFSECWGEQWHQNM